MGRRRQLDFYHFFLSEKTNSRKASWIGLCPEITEEFLTSVQTLL